MDKMKDCCAFEFTSHCLFCIEFNWWSLTFVGRSCKWTIYVSSSNYLICSFHLLLKMFLNHLYVLWQRRRWSIWRTSTSQASYKLYSSIWRLVCIIHMVVLTFQKPKAEADIGPLLRLDNWFHFLISLWECFKIVDLKDEIRNNR